MKGKGASVAEVHEILDRLPLFSDISEGCLQVLTAACRIWRIQKGEILFFQGDTAEAAYVVHTGRISIALGSPDGREMIIDEMKPGEIFGEVGLLTQKTHSASAIAITNSQVLIIPREPFLEVLEGDPGFARRILEILAHRLHRSAMRELALAFMDAQSRLARHLLGMDQQGQDKGYITASQEELARGTGLIRQTVAKALGRWRREGWLLTGRGRILILNRKALEQVERALLISE